MDKIDIRCPHCGEEMSVPKDRSQIICMFCGKDILLENGAVTSGDKSKEEAEKALGTALLQMDERLFAGEGEMVRKFSKDTYADLFETYKKDHYDFFTAVRVALLHADEEQKKDIFAQITKQFVKLQEKNLEAEPKKREKYAKQMDRNMFMVIYVLPALKEISLPAADELCNYIAKVWGESFKESKIEASDFDSIMEGFHKKLCYVTTAVCVGLDKGRDCEELRLIKGFRDGFLQKEPDGETLINEYYDIAPTIVKRIDRCSDKEDIYRDLWMNYILPCVVAIRTGDLPRCKKLYCNMVENLKKQYIH